MKTLVVDGVLNLASQGSINYSQAQSNEVSMLNEMSGKLDDTLKQIQDVGIKEEEKTEPTAIYAKLYDDGTLILSSTEYTEPGKNVQVDYEDISHKEYYIDPQEGPKGDFIGWIDMSNGSNK